MTRPTLRVSVLVLALATPQVLHAATQEQNCRKAVNGGIAKLYKEALKGTQGCFKTRIKTAGATNDCLGDPAQYDPNGKLPALTAKLAATMAATGTCGPLGAQFGPACTGAPPVCAAACASCATGTAAAGCLACRVVELTKGQVAALYGDPPDLTGNSDAQGCQNTLGKETAKSGQARMKAQQKCQQDVGNGKMRVSCIRVDFKGKIAKASTKATAKIVGKCVDSPGSDQIPTLDGAATCLAGGTAPLAAACAAQTATATAEAIFQLVSAPASVSGFVMATDPAGNLVPLPGVRIEIVGANLGLFTDQNGAYLVRGVPPGQQFVAIDGQRVGNYPRVAMGVPIAMVGDTSMGIFAMPAIDMANAVDVGGLSTANPDGSRTLTSPVMLTNPTIPGAALDLPAGTTITFDLPNRSPLLTVSVVPTNVMPFPPGVFSDQIFSFQPEGSTISPPANVTFPNNTGFGDGTSVDIYVPDFATNSFFLAGTGTVTTGGTLIESDGPVIDRFDWHFPGFIDGCQTDIIGRVVDTNLQPVPAAILLAVGTGTVSGANGTFQFNNFPCPPIMTVNASKVTALGLQVGVASAPTVINGITDVGDIVLHTPECGDGILTPPEQCDDGNNAPTDGCGPTCLFEECGNAVVDPGEECDSSVSCTALCTICGDGLVRLPGEECDAGAQNGVAGSGCNSNCHIALCGNGVIEEGEECDDGNANGGVACDEECRLREPAGAITTSLVRSTIKCDYSNYNTSSAVGFQIACAPPPIEGTVFQFGPSGRGTFSAGLVLGGTDAVLRAELTDVRDNANALITTASGWRLHALLRVTLQGAGASDVTLTDVEFDAAARLDAPGALSASGSVAAFAGGDFSTFTRHNIEILDVAIGQEGNGMFARPGFLLPRIPSFTIDTPLVAAGGNVTMAMAFVGCGGPGGNTPNVTRNGIAGCSPPETFFEHTGPFAPGWTFGPSPAITVTVNVTGPDIAIAGQGGPIDVHGGSGGGKFALALRATIVDPNGEMSLSETSGLPWFQYFDVPVVNGQLAFTTTVHTLWEASNNVPPLPSMQATLAAPLILYDANGDPFAQSGLTDGPP